MRRHLKPEEMRLWARVAETVRLAPGRAAPVAPPEPPPQPPAPSPAASAHAPASVHHRRKPAPRPAEDLEPGRRRLLVRERVIVDARLDLHGLDYDRARAALRGFIAQSRALGRRHVLIITGKGLDGFGVLRQFTPQWLAEPGVRDHVAAVGPAHRRHGGEGALYVALKAPRP